MHAFSSGEKSAKNFRGVDDNITVQITQDGADWSLDIMGKVEITETIGNPDAIGGGTEINDFEEQRHYYGRAASHGIGGPARRAAADRVVGSGRGDYLAARQR